MAKPTLAADQIQTELQQQVNNIQEIREDNATVIVPLPYWHEIDELGCNWNISSIRGGNGYMGAIGRIVSIYRMQVDLAHD
ncbi:hypothetical protein [Polynucleobacter sp. MWH-UH25E]|uniref:hypothetical protein n=1 Tax=Polynucleobacter sp. MWH-UH25E TaxID=1855616 RepID=UPI001BFEC141|nr:hypothetical protein [Polynucleobacter sp. MWH-UH25E]QWD62826.1 hypothetical protein ICV39_04245 [Polynucleobacter sp. MWH-UH25E]